MNYFPITFVDSGGSTITNLSYSQRSQTLASDVGPTPFQKMTWFGTATVSTPSNKNWLSTEVNTLTDLVTTATAHGLFQGQAITVTTGGSLPTGLATSTTYYVYRASATAFGFCTSVADANNAALINLSGAGAGTSTAVVTALAGCSVKLQGSFDGTNWADVPNNSVSITGTASVPPQSVYSIDYGMYAWYFTVTSGSIALSPFQAGYGGV
jgi:hypothetical protein